MNRRWRSFVGLIAVLFAIPFLCVAVPALLTSGTPWWFRALPPTPPQARQIQTELLRDYTSVADGTLRETQFTIDQPESAIQTFYQTTLTTQGWTYQGRIRPQCGAYFRGVTDVEEVYDRAGRTLIIHIRTPAPHGSRQVLVVEYQGRLDYPMQPTPPPTPRLPTALIGDWQASGEAADRTWTLCVYEQGVVHLVGPGPQSLSGRYQ
jgi:hypothetical protein